MIIIILYKKVDCQEGYKSLLKTIFHHELKKNTPEQFNIKWKVRFAEWDEHRMLYPVGTRLPTREQLDKIIKTATENTPWPIKSPK